MDERLPRTPWQRLALDGPPLWRAGADDMHKDAHARGLHEGDKEPDCPWCG